MTVFTIRNRYDAALTFAKDKDCWDSYGAVANPVWVKGSGGTACSLGDLSHIHVCGDVQPQNWDPSSFCWVVNGKVVATATPCVK